MVCKPGCQPGRVDTSQASGFSRTCRSDPAGRSPAAMEWTITLSVAGASLVSTVFAAWRSGRPRKDSLQARWIPWRFVVLVSSAVLLLSVVHAVNLMGVTTGGGMLGGPARP